MSRAIADAVLAGAVGLLTMMFGAGAYQAVVIAPNWRTPEGLLAYRTLIHRRHDGHYFQVLAPVTIVVAVAAVILSLAAGTNAVLAGWPLAAVTLAEVFTVVYFMPPNRRLFFTPAEAQPGALSRALVRRWERANLVRLAIMAAGVVAGLLALVHGS